MNTEQISELERRAAVHAALADPTRLRVVDLLALGDAASSELAATLDVPTNLLAHHLRTLAAVGLVARRRSEGDRRRSYWQLLEVPTDATAAVTSPRRLVFVCTANSARSHLAAALWARASTVPVASAGTHPAERVHPGAVAAAARYDVPLPADATPRTFADLHRAGDLVVTVCDRAHEELDVPALHWSVPDPVRTGTAAAFDRAVGLLTERVGTLASRLAS